MKKGKVDIRKKVRKAKEKPYGYEVTVGGDAVEFAKTKVEAEKKADRLRKLKEKLKNKKYK